MFKLPPCLCKIVLKMEVHLAQKATMEEFVRVAENAREFFIPDALTVIMAQLVHAPRQLLERGFLIQIGRDWNKGGMFYFATRFRYDDPDMIYISFDISGYDTSVNVFFLMIYSTWSKRYYKFKNSTDEAMYDFFAQEVTSRLSVKITQMIGDIWRILTGIMTSGAYETSHGDSWITALVYICFFEYLRQRDVEFRKIFDEEVAAGRHILAVYGVIS